MRRQARSLPIGTCRLCLQERELRESHLIPRAMYKYLRNPGDRNAHPVVVGRAVTSTTSRQVTDYLLCAECEDLFNKQGEAWMLRQLWNGKRFPLRERLKVALQRYTFHEALVFSGTGVGIDTDRLGYFALSVIWRAGVHEWKTPFGDKTRKLDLGRAEESIRRFLVGETAFPSNVVVMATVCDDRGSTGSFYMPSEVTGIPIKRFAFLALGVHFMVFVGDDLPPILKEFCCVRSSKHLIFERSCEEKTVQAFAQLMLTSKPSAGLMRS